MKTILVPTDYSKSSVNAAHYAITLAKQTKSRILLMHAFQIPVISSEAAVVVIPFEDLEKLHTNKLKKLTESLRKKHGNAVEISYSAEAGFAVDVIEELVKSKKIDLVIMGIKGASKVSEIIIGSTASSVAGNIKCAALIIPEKAAFEKPKKIVFASDNEKPTDVSNLKVLKELAGIFKSKIMLLNVSNGVKSQSIEKKKISKIESYFNAMSCSTHFTNNKYDDVVPEINEFAKKNRANMVVMIARKHSLLNRLFNERKTKKMVFHTHIPLLVLNDK